MNKIIYDENIVREFIKILPDASNLETYFISLSARKKYLSKEDQKIYKLNGMEMFCKQIINYKKDIITYIKRCETNSEAFITKDNLIIPNYIIVCYINLFCSSSIKAIEEFNIITMKNIFQYSTSKGNSQLENSINNSLETLINCYKNSKGTSIFIDIDFDIPKSAENLVNEFCKKLLIEHNVDTYIIDTKSGFHVMIDRKNLNHNYNKDIEYINEIAKKQIETDFLNGIIWDKWEIKNNKNLMVPIPGTLQGLHKVTFKKFII